MKNRNSRAFDSGILPHLPPSKPRLSAHGETVLMFVRNRIRRRMLSRVPSGRETEGNPLRISHGGSPEKESSSPPSSRSSSKQRTRRPVPVLGARSPGSRRPESSEAPRDHSFQRGRPRSSESFSRPDPGEGNRSNWRDRWSSTTVAPRRFLSNRPSTLSKTAQVLLGSVGCILLVGSFVYRGPPEDGTLSTVDTIFVDHDHCPDAKVTSRNSPSTYLHSRVSS